MGSRSAAKARHLRDLDGRARRRPAAAIDGEAGSDHPFATGIAAEIAAVAGSALNGGGFFWTEMSSSYPMAMIGAHRDRKSPHETGPADDRDQRHPPARGTGWSRSPCRADPWLPRKLVFVAPPDPGACRGRLSRCRA